MAYVANKAENLYSTIDLNQVNPAIDDGSEQLGRPLTASCPAPIGLGIPGAPCYPYIGFLDFLGNEATSQFESLQVTLTHRYSKGLYLLGGYTWEHAIDVAGATTNTASNFIPRTVSTIKPKREAETTISGTALRFPRLTICRHARDGAKCWKAGN